MEVDNDQLRAIVETDPVTATQVVAVELPWSVFPHLKQIGRVKKLDKWAPHELTANPKKNHRFEVLSSFILGDNERFLNWIDVRQKVDFK